MGFGTSLGCHARPHRCTSKFWLLQWAALCVYSVSDCACCPSAHQSPLMEERQEMPKKKKKSAKATKPSKATTAKSKGKKAAKPKVKKAIKQVKKALKKPKAKKAIKKAKALKKPKAKKALKRAKALKKPRAKKALKALLPAMEEKAELLSSETVFEGPLFRVLRDRLIEPGGKLATRDIVHHNGSVA